MSLSGNNQYAFTSLDGTAWPQFTVEYWVYSASTPPYGEEGQFQWAPANTPIAGDPFILLAHNSDGNLRLYFDGDYRASYALTNSAWHHVAATWDAGHVATLYVDGISRGSYTSPVATVYRPHANVVYFGTGYYATLTGTEGECRVSNAARSADWVRTEYNSQSAPAAFYSLGSSQ
jgi:Concanavalin A-like lectin/glucanases superfamily